MEFLILEIFKIEKKIDFNKRKKELLKLLEKHRGKHGEFDCIVPGSGGKDSCFASHILKYEYGMNFQLLHGLQFYIPSMDIKILRTGLALVSMKMYQQKEMKIQ